MTRIPPSPGENNIWYRFTGGDSVIVFVHGVLSDSRSCWLSEPRAPLNQATYWPELLCADPRFREYSIFLGGYYTAVDAGPYEIRNCADELRAALARTDAASRKPVLSHDRILFICHSTGGIVVRYLLDKHHTDFAEKDLGLVLIASPSYGSALANRLDLLARVYRHRVGQQLQWGSWSLSDLDARFKDLIHQRRIPRLRGVEAYENHFVIHRKFLPPRKLIVNEQSAGRYFGAPKLLRKTDHFTSVKPHGMDHPAYELLVDFVAGEFQAQSRSSVQDQIQVVSPRKERSSYPRDDTAPALPDNYELKRHVYTGHYSMVRQCVNKVDRRVCAVKHTLASMVSLPALEHLQKAAISGIVTPSKVWVDGEYVWEELPWIDGWLLSDAVLKGVGTLSGSLLEDCRSQLTRTLCSLRDVGLIYRDIHPDNLFAVVCSPGPDWPKSLLADIVHHWKFDYLLSPDLGEHEKLTALNNALSYRIQWVLIDSTSVCLAADAKSAQPLIHGGATPPEQALGSPLFASDIYALGATLFYGLTGVQFPVQAQGHPNGRHCSTSNPRNIKARNCVSISFGWWRPTRVYDLPRTTNCPTTQSRRGTRARYGWD